jgi:hypothetical protein
MSKKFYTIFLVLTFSFLAIAGSGKSTEAKRYKVADDSKQISTDINKVSYNLNPKMEKAAIGTKSVIGNTFYDYTWNSGSPTHTVYWNGKTYMGFVGKATETAAREYTYVSYDGTTFAAPQAVVAAATMTTYFSGLDVFRGGDGDGVAAVGAGYAPGGTASYFALESAPGAGGFTSAVVSTDRDAAVLTLSSTGKVLFKDTKGRSDYKFQLSTDFGTTWSLVETTVVANSLTKLTGQSGPTLDASIFRFPDGGIGIGCTVPGLGSLEPTGSVTMASKDSADLIGYFKSTNDGVSWTWTTASYGGSSDMEADFYNLWTNFDQSDWCAGPANDVRGVSNAYPYYYKISGSDTTQYNSMGVGFWSKATGVKKLHNFDSKDTNIQAFIGVLGESANAYGCAYPSIAQSANGNVIVCTWSQPSWNGATVDTNVDGFPTYDMWYNVSVDAGATWKGAMNLTETPGSGELFGTLAEDLEMIDATHYKARMSYINDKHGQAAPFDGINFAEDIVYHEWIIDAASSVKPEVGVAKTYALEQNYPNPFNPSTTINFSLPVSGNATLTVFNTLGQEVATLVNEYINAGSYSVALDGSNLSSGVYLYKLQSGNFNSTKKMVLTK